MTLGLAAAIVAIVIVATLAQTIAGFGFSLVAVPPLGLVMDAKDAVAVALPLLLTSSATVVWSERDRVDVAAVRTLLVGAVVGLPLGLVVIVVASTSALQAVLGLAVLASVALLVSGWSLVDSSRSVDLGCGFLCGFLTTSLNTNGPPVVVALQGRALPSDRFRPTVSAVLGSASLAGAVLFAAAGRFTGDVGRALAVGLPALIVGWQIGLRMRPRMPEERFRSLVLGLLVVSAVMTLLAAFT